MHFRQATLSFNDKTQLLLPDKSNSFDEIFVDFRQESMNGGQQWSVFLHPKEDIKVNGLELQFEVPAPVGTRFFANGYQSWSESRLYDLDESIPRLRGMARKHLGYSGDEHIAGIPRGRGMLHSWTYTYFKKPGATVLAGSLSERTGFTLFLFDARSNILTVRKDLEGLALGHSFPALDIWVGESSERDVFDAWFQTMGLAIPAVEAGMGWTSWYRHFTHISADILTHDLEGLTQSGLPFRYFQIDDGWQTAVGDWLSIKPGFPQGMGNMAAKIKGKGLEPGLWLAPFVAWAKSELARRNPEWLLKDGHGKPIKAGWNPMWGGWYYALDFYNTGVRDYLSGVFHTVLDKWGYELLKLDFLFAVCLAPPPGKTRGAVMWEAMEFLRTLAGKRKILACGAPLGACFGQVDFCRIGGDIHLKWEHGLLAWLRHRERVSSIASLRSTLGRWQLNGKGFLNDPDVFILRKEKQHLSVAQQHTILTINVLLGGLLFTSDDLGAYSPEQLSELAAALDLRGSLVQDVSMLELDVYRINFMNQGERFEALCNLSARRVFAGNSVELLPFETLILQRH
jgi:alpha-galactosidase